MRRDPAVPARRSSRDRKRAARSGDGFLTYLVSTAVGFATSIGVWGTAAHSLGLLPPEAFGLADDHGITLPPMPR